MKTTRRMRSAARCLAAAATALGACLVMSGCTVTRLVESPDPCGLKGVWDCGRSYSLEIVNDAGDRVRVSVDMDGQSFRGTHRSGVLVLESGERRTFEVGAGIGSCPDDDGLYYNKLVAMFVGIHFYHSDSIVPFRSYPYTRHYEVSRCEDLSGGGLEAIHMGPDKRGESLFVKSADRPFYLERDNDDSELARIVITFVPSAEPDAEDTRE